MYAFTQDLPITTDVYRRILDGIGPVPPSGCIVHAVLKIDGGLRYVDIWESRESCDRFLEERVHPVLQAAFNAAGATLPAEPVRSEFELIDLNVQAPALADVA